MPHGGVGEKMNAQKSENEMLETVDRKILRSPLLLITVILFAVGFILSVVSLARLLDPSHRLEIIDGLGAQNIVDSSATITWFGLVVLTKVFFTLYSFTFTLGLGMLLVSYYSHGEKGSLKGLSLIGKVSHKTVYLWYAFSALAVIVFVYKLISRIVILVDEVQEFLFPVVAVVSGEIVMLLAAALVVGLIIKSLKETSDLMYQSYYMLRTGRAESHIDPVCYIVFFAIAALCAYIAYFLFYDILAILCFSTLSLASLLMGICVRLFKKEVEWIKYRNYKRRKLTEEVK